MAWSTTCSGVCREWHSARTPSRPEARWRRDHARPRPFALSAPFARSWHWRSISRDRGRRTRAPQGGGCHRRRHRPRSGGARPSRVGSRACSPGRGYRRHARRFRCGDCGVFCLDGRSVHATREDHGTRCVVRGALCVSVGATFVRARAAHVGGGGRKAVSGSTLAGCRRNLTYRIEQRPHVFRAPCAPLEGAS